jgi:hypothetical protein
MLDLAPWDKQMELLETSECQMLKGASKEKKMLLDFNVCTNINKCVCL